MLGAWFSNSVISTSYSITVNKVLWSFRFIITFCSKSLIFFLSIFIKPCQNYFTNIINFSFLFDRLKKAYTKISKFSEVLSYFSTKEWKFYNNNVQNLYKELNEADKHIFDFDMSGVEWNEYFNTYVRGIRTYLLKDPIETVPQGITKHYRLKYIHYFVCTVLGFIVLRLLWGIFSSVLGF